MRQTDKQTDGNIPHSPNRSTDRCPHSTHGSPNRSSHGSDGGPHRTDGGPHRTDNVAGEKARGAVSVWRLRKWGTPAAPGMGPSRAAAFLRRRLAEKKAGTKIHQIDGGAESPHHRSNLLICTNNVRMYV